MKDIIGTAFLDYYHGNYSDDIINETNISEEDELPLPDLCRTFSDMPKSAYKALQSSGGSRLDAGCGSAVQSLCLQEKGVDVMAIDTSPGAIRLCRLRGGESADY